MPRIASGLLTAGIFCTIVWTSALAADPAAVCESSKLRISSSYSGCLLKVASTAVKRGISPDFTKCDSKFFAKFPLPEAAAGLGVCPSEGDVGDIGQRIFWNAEAVSTELAGGVAVDRYFPATGQTVTYGSGDDGDIRAGALQAFVDNGDGTVTDTNTGLMWEKKRKRDLDYNDCSMIEAGACTDPHDADNYYSWSASSPSYDGGAVTMFLNQLNNRCDNDTTISCAVDADCTVVGGPCGFAGHRDWRLPNINELLSLIDRSASSPALNPAFHGASCGGGCVDLADPACSCDANSNHWSATTVVSNSSQAWGVETGSGSTNPLNKSNLYFVRAVRSGS